MVASKRFAVCPTGGGVQSPKVFEAILLLTIPIVQAPGAAAYVALRELGWPLAIVESWDEVTPERMDEWWIELSPFLENARWMYLSSLWVAFTAFPCPIDSIADFLDYVGNLKH
jgi:hypothetical protein